MKILLLTSLILIPSAQAASILSCAQVERIAKRCETLSRNGGATEEDALRALSTYLACVEKATGLSFEAARKKYDHCR